MVNDTTAEISAVPTRPAPKPGVLFWQVPDLRIVVWLTGTTRYTVWYFQPLTSLTVAGAVMDSLLTGHHIPF